MELSVNETVKVDESIVKKYHSNFINSFKSRGWSLYKADQVVVNSLDELEKLVINGSEKEELTNDTLYQVLPLIIEDDSDWDKVKKAMENCLITRRLPCFVDISPDEIDEKGNESLKAKSVYLIDSVYFDEKKSMFVLVPDYDLMFMLGIKQRNEGNIVLELSSAAGKISRQLTMQKRKVNNESNSNAKSGTNSIPYSNR